MRTRILIALLFCSVAVMAKVDQTEYDRLKARTDVYLDKVQKQPDWLLSRLQMYWSSHATDVYFNNETFDHPGGDRAPVPTVKFAGTRSHGTDYNRPRLEDVVPYDDDADGSVTYVNKSSGQKEKVHPSKTGNQISSLNRQILGIARDAARLYAENGDERYAKMKPSAYFINCGRGTALDGEALCRALEQGVIAGAAADVTEIEPLPADHPLWKQPNMIITPHISGGFHLPVTLENIVSISLKNFEAWLKGEELRNVIDFTTGYKK